MQGRASPNFYAGIPRAEPSGSGAIEQSHETRIHVVLHVAVEEAQARLIGGEVKGGHFLGAAEHRYVLDHPGRRHPDDTRDLKAVTVQVDWVRVVGGIA